LAERPVDELNEPDELASKDLDDEVVALDDEELEGDGLEEAAEDDEDDDDTEDGTEGAAVGSSEDDDSDEASLDALLAKRSAKRGSEDSEDSEEDIMALVGSARDEAIVEPLPIRAQPIRDRQEFVCSRCRLVKPKVQLADEASGLCRDCV
jgi:hypothetical protein